MTSKCIRHTWFELHAQLGKDIRQLGQVSKIAWAPLATNFLQHQRNFRFAEYLDDPVCHCFDAEGGADVDWVDAGPNPVELDDSVKFSDAPEQE